VKYFTKNRHLSTNLTRIRGRGVILTLLTLFVAGLMAPLSTITVQAEAAWPTTPPAQICGDTDLLNGPVTAPAGAVTVPAGSNEGFDFNRPGATFWFESGTHTLGGDLFGQIVARDNATYVGAPGAVIDGQNLNLYAFTGFADDVTVKHLTIKNFGRGMDNNNEGVVNHDAGTGWTIEYNTVVDNDGAGVFIGTDNVVRYNCLKDNGQYGFSMFKMPVEGDSAIKNIELDHNEIAGNNTDDWESHIDGCGCTGGGKFWDVEGAAITNNWVHDNLSTGLWADTNNIDFLFEGNYIEGNSGEGIWYEISYNATIRNNTIKGNAWVSGQANTGSPGAAIYLSESGGDSRLASSVSGAAEIRIYDNNFVNNFSGVSIYENANRFCNSNGNTSKGYCTPFVTPTLIPEEPRSYEYVDPISQDHPCYTQIANEPYKTDCRWHAQNIKVYQNEFYFDKAAVPCAGRFCGAQAMYATGDNNLSWSPYTVAGVQNDVMFNNGNSFHDNTYFGDWVFAKGYGETMSFNDWQAGSFNQDANSTFDGDPTYGGEGDGQSNGGGDDEEEETPVVVVPNDLDADTAGLENGIGQWNDWYSESVSRSSDAAHSGDHSLRVDVTAPWGWGVEAANWPGFATTSGLKSLSMWGKLGSGTNLTPKMTVKWLDENFAVLQTNDVTLPALTTEWQNISALVEVPAGAVTARVILSGSGSAGDYLYLDDMVVGDAPNVLDSATSGGEGSAGEWSGWWSADITATTDQAYKGNGSLRVDVTDPWGWAAQIGNWPGFEVGAGDKRITFAAKQGSGNISDVTLRVTWFDANQEVLQTTDLPLEQLSAAWQMASADVTAPAGTASAHLELQGSGDPGDSLYLDGIAIYNKN
jgi:parallel beta-helix repeat protein